MLKKSVITTGKDGSKFPINELKKCDERAALHIKKLCHCTKQNYIWKTLDIIKITRPEPDFNQEPKQVVEFEPKFEGKIFVKRKKKDCLDKSMSWN